MMIRTLFGLFGAFMLALSGYLLYDYNIFAEKFTGAQMEILRNRARLKDLEKQVNDVTLERSLTGVRLPQVCVDEYLHNRKTLLLLATSQDCSPCTEKELKIWREFLNKQSLTIPLLCLYYRFNKSQYGKYEDVYGEVFPFTFDEYGLYEHLGIDDTPLVLLVNGDGVILFAHRPDMLHSEKTEEFLRMLVRLT